jgi:hypothetical protein
LWPPSPQGQTPRASPGMFPPGGFTIHLHVRKPSRQLDYLRPPRARGSFRGVWEAREGEAAESLGISCGTDIALRHRSCLVPVFVSLFTGSFGECTVGTGSRICGTL